MAAIVISPVNRKGGVGKSSSVFHLAGHFALHGQRVLLIDNEPVSYTHLTLPTNREV